MFSSDALVKPVAREMQIFKGTRAVDLKSIFTEVVRTRRKRACVMVRMVSTIRRGSIMVTRIQRIGTARGVFTCMVVLM